MKKIPFITTVALTMLSSATGYSAAVIVDFGTAGGSHTNPLNTVIPQAHSLDLTDTDGNASGIDFTYSAAGTWNGAQAHELLPTAAINPTLVSAMGAHLGGVDLSSAVAPTLQRFHLPRTSLGVPNQCHDVALQ